jgi:hypothetical protein
MASLRSLKETLMIASGRIVCLDRILHLRNRLQHVFDGKAFPRYTGAASKRLLGIATSAVCGLGPPL